jgi:starvation-inducible DNA-binding protein
MHRSRIDLADNVRAASTRLLQQRLAEAIDLKLQAKQAHWTVKGPSFIALHELFDQTAQLVEQQTDSIAERMAALGGTPEGTVQAVQSRSSLKPYPLDISDGQAHAAALSDALASFGRSVRAGIKEAGEVGDEVTAGLLTTLAEMVDKQLWFVEAHLQAER